jgi:hypothetical protein
VAASYSVEFPWKHHYCDYDSSASVTAFSLAEPPKTMMKLWHGRYGSGVMFIDPSILGVQNRLVITVAKINNTSFL